MPTPVSDWEVKLGPKQPYELVPLIEEIPRAFKAQHCNDWYELVTTWFYHGLPDNTVFVPREGAEFTQDLAERHITAALRCTTIPLKDLFMGLAWLLSQWYTSVEIPGVKKFS